MVRAHCCAYDVGGFVRPPTAANGGSQPQIQKMLRSPSPTFPAVPFPPSYITHNFSDITHNFADITYKFSDNRLNLSFIRRAYENNRSRSCHHPTRE